MSGWAGAILYVDLSKGAIEKKRLEEKMGRDYLGGRGINSRILYDDVKPGTDALSPENVLIFGTGPLAGTMAPSPNKTNVTAKSTLYTGVGQSNAGGRFPAELKHAGYDHLVIRGKAEEPVYLWIDDDKVELRSAKELWGKSTWETEHIIQEELGDPEIKVGSIGPAGERLVRFCSILFTLYRSASQTGMGTVMGSKNLKAVAVRGTKSVKVANPKLLKSLTQEINQRMYKGMTYPLFSTHGSPIFIETDSTLGLLAIRNYQQSGNWRGMDNFRPDAIFPYYTKDKACHGCPVHCGHFFNVKEGPYKGEKGSGIDAGHIYSFGSLLDNTYLPSVFRAVNLSNQYGMDMFELSTAIAAAMEWYEKGIITKKDTDGIALEWGNHEAIIEMIHKIGKREGIGDLLAEGGYHAAKKLGKEAEECVSYCKGTLLIADDVRAMKGTALCHVTSTIPAHHEEGAPMMQDRGFPSLLVNMKEEFDIEEYVPTAYDKKARPVVYYQNVCTIMDAVELCKFCSVWAGQELTFEVAADLFSAATGIEMDVETIQLVAERIHDLERAFAVREGMTRKDDHIYGKIAKEPVQSGPHKGEYTDPEKFDAMLDEYYELRGWDKETGIPTRAKLERVGLKDVADELERMGKLPSEGEPSPVKKKSKG